MIRLAKIKSYLILSAIALIIVFSCTGLIVVQAEPPSKVEERLADINEEEKKILQNLFTLEQEIVVMEHEEKELAGDIEAIKLKIKNTEAAIAAEEISYAKKQEALKQVLRSYQRMGPGSYLEIIMNSDSLSTFLRRINTLRDMTRNTGKLLAQLEQSKNSLSIEKTKLAEALTLMEEKKKKSEAALAEKLKLKNDKELYLASLKGEREHYQKYLADIQQMWNELRPFFAKVAVEFTDMIKTGGLPPNAVKISFSLFNIKGTIEEKVFNDIVAKKPNLSEIVFAFHPGKIEMKLPAKNLTLSGNFAIIDGQILKFQVEEGSFYGLPLEPGSIEELFSEGDLVLDFKTILGRNILKSIEIKDGYLELSIR